MAFEGLTPVGRLVQGHPMKGYDDKDDNGVIKLNQDGTPKKTYLATLAVEKQNPEWPGFYGSVWNEGRAAFPSLFDPQSGACLHRDFAWKIQDGDGVDNVGKPLSAKPGYAGHWIIKISSSFPMNCYIPSAQGPLAQLVAGQEDTIYKGCYLQIGVSVKGNDWKGDAKSKPGVYINPQAVRFIGHGERINSGPDANKIFAAAAGYVPQGVSNTPLAGNAPMPMQQQQAPAPQPMQMAPQPMGMQPQPMPGQMATAPQPMAMQQAPAPMGMPGQMATAPQPMGQQPQYAAPGQMAPQPMQQAPAPMQMAPQPQQPAYQPPQQAVPQLHTPQPNHGFVQNAVAPQYQLTPLGQQQGFTKEQWNAQGYNDEALVQSGILVRIA